MDPKIIFSELEKLATERDELKAKVESFNTNEALAEANAKLGISEAKLATAHANLTNANSKLGITEAALTEANAKLGTTEAALIESNAKLGITETALTEANAKLGITEAALTEANAKLGTTEAALTESNAKLGTTEAALVDVNGQLSSMEAALTEANAKLAADDDEVAADDDEVAADDDEVAADDEDVISGYTKKDLERAIMTVLKSGRAKSYMESVFDECFESDEFKNTLSEEVVAIMDEPDFDKAVKKIIANYNEENKDYEEADDEIVKIISLHKIGAGFTVNFEDYDEVKSISLKAFMKKYDWHHDDNDEDLKSAFDSYEVSGDMTGINEYYTKNYTSKKRKQ